MERHTFLNRVRQAVQTGNRAGVARELAPRGPIGYQGAGVDPAARFCDQLLAAGGHPHLVPNSAAAVAKVLELVQPRPGRRILLGNGRFVDPLNLAAQLRAHGAETWTLDSLPQETLRKKLFEADIGVSGVEFLIAETGSLVFFSSPEESRSLSLLPPVHVVVAHRDQLVADLFDLFDVEAVREKAGLSSCVSVVTGPSKTGDIELRLVTGVHGPGELHVVLTDSLI
jgi:L-lactate utilization protein LutC